MVKNAYIHIPFCTKKCNYCSFISFDKLTMKSIYIDALLEEIKENYKNELLETLYFGGGTPSVLSTADFEKILELLNFDNNTELTVEINPNGIEKNYLQELKKLGVNRLSIGIQVFDDKILKQIGRTHNVKDVFKVIEYAQNLGFENVNIDLIYGLPTQTLENFENSLKNAVKLGIQHISLYGLKIEEGCNFYNNRPDFIPDNDFQADMYLLACDYLAKNGFERYEMSNFAKPNYYSRHNLNYWANNSYYGFGTAAHGYKNGIRYENTKDIEKYIQNPIEPIVQNKLTSQQILEEEIFLGLRKEKGINIENINKKYKIDFNKKYSNILNKYCDSKHLLKTQTGYKFSTNGILQSNFILSEFIEI